MGESKRTIIVHMFDDDNGDLQFNMSGYGVHNQEIHCSKDDARRPMKKNQSHTVTFEINNRSSQDLLFPTDPSRAMWVGTDGTTCPRATPAPHADFPLKGRSVSTDREQLTVENVNSCKADFKFSLNFVQAGNAAEAPLIPYDPIWNNQNGGSNR
jgi:hypothetical protein